LLQDPSQINGDKLNNATCKTSRHFREREREGERRYMKGKIE